MPAAHTNRRQAAAVQAQTYRMRVLAVVQASTTPLTGQQISDATGFTYKQTIDALNALNNAAKIARIGRKFTARWCRVTTTSPTDNAAHALEQAFRGFFR